MKSIRTLSTGTIAAIVAVLLVPSVAYAHHLPTSATLWNTHSTLTIRVTQSFPGGDFVNRLDSARNEWNSLGTTRTVNRDANRIADFDATSQCPPTAATISIHWMDTTLFGRPDAVGVATSCRYVGTNDRSNAMIAFDPDRDWYTGTGDANDGFLNTCLNGCQIDFWSIASHELGHAMGFGHFLETDSVCGDNSGHHTMCPTYKGGTERDRTFEAHEEETFHITY